MGYFIVVVDKANPLGYIGYTVTRNPERTVTMSTRHTQHYFDLNPRTREKNPHPMLFVVGAFFTVGALWLTTAFLFSL